MLFNSFEFYFVFLPLTALIFFSLGRLARNGRALAVWFLSAASIGFYAWWNPVFILLIIAEVVFSFLVGRRLSRPGIVRGRRGILIAAITLILAVLAYFKYTNFLLGNLHALLEEDYHPLAIILPLGISFHTFQQIAYLVDAYRGRAPLYRFADFLLFVTFFPQLIAGPIVHHDEMLPQMTRRRFTRFRPLNLLLGLSIFAVGLCKKTLIADTLAPTANEIFALAQNGEPLGTLAAWRGALAYTLQLYFDFSGYSDMAIGLARIFNIRFPANFDSPYKAVTIADFWRRWHMTLSRFLRDYLYIPLGGNRHGRRRQIANLMLTMLLGGLWHGAGWTFLIWGGLHGSYLVINHLWRQLSPLRLPSLLSWLLTMLGVVLAWVFFRAADAASALSMIGAMLWPAAEARADAGDAGAWLLLAVAGALATLAPNSADIFSRFSPTLADKKGEPGLPRRLLWRPTIGWGMAGGLATAAGLIAIFGWKSEFLYFQF